MSGSASSAGPSDSAVEMPLPVAVAEILELARADLQMDVAILGQVEDGRQIHVAIAGPAETYNTRPGLSLPFEESVCSRMLSGQAPPAMGDLRREPATADLPAAERLGVRAYIGAPVVLDDGSLYGTVCCLDRRTRPGFSHQQHQQLVFVSNLLARTIDRVRAATRARDELRATVESMIATKAFSCVFQRIEDLGDPDLTAFEALTRFPQEPRRAPDLWFGDAWSVSLGVELELAATELALGTIGAAQPGATLFVNASPETIMDERFFALLTQPRTVDVVVEVTEHAHVHDYDALRDSLRRLRAHGIRSAVDDAGAGYASLSHIVRLHPDLIKMDVFFVRGIDQDRVKRSMASSLATFARDIGARVLAEGVETPGELEAVRDLGFDLAQGFLLDRPMSADELVASPG